MLISFMQIRELFETIIKDVVKEGRIPWLYFLGE